METQRAGACSGHRANHSGAGAPARAPSSSPRLCQVAAGLTQALIPTVGPGFSESPGCPCGGCRGRTGQGGPWELREALQLAQPHWPARVGPRPSCNAPPLTTERA